MWDWSSSKKASSDADLSKEDTKKELEDLFSFDDESKRDNSLEFQNKPNEEHLEKKVDDKVYDRTKPVSFSVGDFSLNRAVKLGASKREGHVSSPVTNTPAPPPPPASKGTASFVRPNTINKIKDDYRSGDDINEVSAVYAGAMGLREEVHHHGDESMWKMQLRQAGLPGMILAEVSYSPLNKDWHTDLLKGFKRIRRDFFKYIGYHNIEDLTTVGINDDGIKMLKSGRAPENFDIHIKIPLEYGGNTEFSNLCLIQTRPFHEGIHKFIDMQTSDLKDGEVLHSIFIPIPKGNVYIPEVEVTVGGGRKMADKSVYAGFLSSTFKEFAIKTMFGQRARDL